ncbi:MAG: hypothetical protein ACE5IZ_09540 [Dehalococcoidia bacterium]
MSAIELSEKVVLEAFAAGATQGLSERLHIEKQVLYAFGWWILAIRLGDNAFLVRADSYLATTDRFEAQFQALLRSEGLTAVERDPPLADMVTLQAASLVGASWEVWAPSAKDAQEAFRPWAEGKQPAVYGESPAEVLEESVQSRLEVARRVLDEQPASDLPAPRVAVIDLEATLVDQLEAAMPGCEVIPVCTQTTTCAEVPFLAPAVAVVNVDRAGQEAVLELRAGCGRFLPIVALSKEGAGGVLGADTVISSPFTLEALVAAVRDYLPSR